MVEILWNPEAVPDRALVLYVHQHSAFPLTKTLGYFGPLGGRFVQSDSNPPIKTAFEEALNYAKREGVEKLVIVDPVGFGRSELWRPVENQRIALSRAHQEKDEKAA